MSNLDFFYKLALILKIIPTIIDIKPTPKIFITKVG